MARIGYAKVISSDQNLEQKLPPLTHHSRIFTNKQSGNDATTKVLNLPTLNGIEKNKNYAGCLITWFF